MNEESQSTKKQYVKIIRTATHQELQTKINEEYPSYQLDEVQVNAYHMNGQDRIQYLAVLKHRMVNDT